MGKDRFVYAPSQWETTLHCNVVSHWLGAYKNSPCMVMGDVMAILPPIISPVWGEFTGDLCIPFMIGQ